MRQHYPLDPSNGFIENSSLVWTNGNPSVGANGSFPGFEGATYSMTEIVNVIEAAGITPSDADLTQLLKAIRQIIVASLPGSYGPTINGGLAIDSNQDFLLNFQNLVEDDSPQTADLFAFESMATQTPVKISFVKLAAAINALGGGGSGSNGTNGTNGTNGVNADFCVSESNSSSVPSGTSTILSGWGTTSNTFVNGTFDGQTFTVGTGGDGYYYLSAALSLNVLAYNLGIEICVNGVRTGMRYASGGDNQTIGGGTAGGGYHLQAGDKVTVYCYFETGGLNRNFPGANFSIIRLRGN